MKYGLIGEKLGHSFSKEIHEMLGYYQYELHEVAKNDIESKVQELNRLWNLIDVSKLNVSIASRSYELAQDGYRAGLVSQTDLETTRQQMVNAQLSHLQTQIKYLSANYDTAFALNMPIEEFYKTFGNQESK